MNYQQGLVSIVTPVYNAERFIEQTILSVMAQTYTDWELLLIDDCSTDNSGKIIQRYAQQDKRIKYHRLSYPCLSTDKEKTSRRKCFKIITMN